MLDQLTSECGGAQRMRIAVIHGNDGSDVRIGKVCRSLSSMGFDIHFIGWDSRPETGKSIDLGTATPHVMVKATPHGRATVGGKLRFLLHIGKTLARLRPDVACCVNEDNALLALPFRGIFYRRLVCDVFDALVDRHSRRNWLLRCVLRLVSETVRNGADRLIATDQSRYARFGRFRSKCVVVENVPEDPGAELSRTIPDGPTKIYVAGSLLVSRGLEQIIEVVDRVPDVRIVSAGWLYDEYAASTFAKHPKVDFVGIVTARQSLELAASCDAVLAYYVPGTVNNLYASPNKIYDAMSVGRPVILNSETRVSKWVREHRVGWTCPYYDTEALAETVRLLPERRKRLREFAEHARDVFVRGYTWERMETRLLDLYSDLCRPSMPECRSGAC